MKLLKTSRAALDARLGRSVKLDRGDWVVQLLGLFIATDIGFILLHIAYLLSDYSLDFNFSLEQDRGYSEIFQYVKEYWAALVFAVLARRDRSLLYVIWSLFFGYLLADDSLRIHERLGNLVSTQFAFPTLLGLRPQDLGEIAISGSVGLFFLISIGIAYRFADRLSKQTSRSLIGLFLVLGFFGIAVDMLHAIIQFPILNNFFNILEDGGELIVMSVIVCFVLSLLKRDRKHGAIS